MLEEFDTRLADLCEDICTELTGRIVRQLSEALSGLTRAERFALTCCFIENYGRYPDEEDLRRTLLDALGLYLAEPESFAFRQENP